MASVTVLYFVIIIGNFAAQELKEREYDVRNDCKEGKYGLDCEEFCSKTCKRCDQETGRCAECIPGFYGVGCDVRCPMNCGNNCEQFSGVCNFCKAGYHGLICDRQCPSTCKNNTCERKTGACSECENNTIHGEYCNISCPRNCMNISCDTLSGQCVSCKPGFFGKYCQHICSDNCESGLCNMSSGVCNDCKNGYFGSFCNMSCQLNCSDETVDREPRISTDLSEKRDSTEYKVTVAILSVLLVISVALNVAVWIRKRFVSHKATTQTADTYDNLQSDRGGGADAAYSDLVVTSEQQVEDEDYVNAAV